MEISFAWIISNVFLPKVLQCAPPSQTIVRVGKSAASAQFTALWGWSNGRGAPSCGLENETLCGFWSEIRCKCQGLHQREGLLQGLRQQEVFKVACRFRGLDCSQASNSGQKEQKTSPLHPVHSAGCPTLSYFFFNLRYSESSSGESGPTPSCHPSDQVQLEETISHVSCLYLHGSMMTQAIPLLLLLLLLFMGSQGQGSNMKYLEGQTLRVICRYPPRRDEKRWKIWCKFQENERRCKHLIIWNSTSIQQHSELSTSLEDNIYTGITIITMSELRVNNSGIYSCGIYDSVRDNLYIVRSISLEVSPAITSKATPMDTNRPSHSSIFWTFPVFRTLWGLIVVKGLVFTALCLISCARTGARKGRSHCELSQDQKNLN
ncbi:uncharacterized protein LOC141489207 [Macrotis lagotis]|uniref:uncharacterized protein LOC141489207 n=1 Tax=Macrotis lagotis TaxID=92651 RepID=UPI003D69F2CE